MNINTGPLRAPTGPLPASTPTLAPGASARPAALSGPQAPADRWLGSAAPPVIPTGAPPPFVGADEELSSSVQPSNAALRDRSLQDAQQALLRGDIPAASAAFDRARHQDTSAEGVLKTCRAAFLSGDAGLQAQAAQYQKELRAELIARARPALEAHAQELAAAASGLNGLEPYPARMTALFAALTPKVAADIDPRVMEDFIKYNDYETGRLAGFQFAPTGSHDQRRAQEILDRLAPGAGKVAVVRDGVTGTDNADSTGSNFVYIDPALFRETNNAQLAAVLGHELAHASHQDARSDIAMELLAGAIPPLVEPKYQGLPSSTVDLRRKSIKHQIEGARLALARDQEAAADRDGIRTSTRAGFDPREDVRLLQRFGRQETAQGYRDDTNLNHPLSTTRARAIQRQIVDEHLAPRPRK